MITPPESRLRAFPTYRELALSQNRRGRALRALHRAVRNFALPSPRFVSRPALWLVLAVRATYYWSIPVLIGEPLFKAHCKSYGRDLHTGIFLHWISAGVTSSPGTTSCPMGRGRIEETANLG